MKKLLVRLADGLKFGVLGPKVATGCVALTASLFWSEATLAENVSWVGGKSSESMTEPENYSPQRLPTADDTFIIGKNSRPNLPEGESLHLWTASIANVSYERVFITLNPYSELAFDGTDKTVWVSQTGGYNTNHNGTEFTLDHAKMTIGSKVFNIAGINAEGYTNSIVIKTGSTLSLTNGMLKLHGGAYDSPYAKGPYNIIDVREGGVFEIKNASQLILGRSDGDALNSGGVGQGGVLRVSGGSLLSSSTKGRTVGFTHGGSTTGCVEMTAGEIRLAGESSYVVMANQGASVARYLQTGGVFTNGCFYFEKVASGNAPHREIDISGDGVIYQGSMNFNLYSGDTSNPRVVMRIRGSKAFVSTDYYYPHANIQDKPFIYQDYRLTGDAAYGEFPVSRHHIRHLQYDGFRGSYAKKVWGVYRVSPEGGAQLLHTDAVDLLCRNHEGEESFVTDHQAYGGLLFPDLWTAYVETKNNYQRPNGTVGWTHVFGARLNPSAKIVDGVPLANPVARGYIEVPKFRNLQTLKNPVVRLELVPQGGETVASIVDRMKKLGGVDAVADSSVAPYNVCIRLNVKDLVENVTTDKMVFDFSEVNTFDQALGTEDVTVRALIRTATCTYDKPGLILLFR